jgi:hypothetical protein
VLQGEGLEAAIRGISAMASENSEDSRFAKRLFEFALQIPTGEFSRVLNRLRKPGCKRHDLLRAELLGYWMESNAPEARAYLTALPTLERARLIGPAADAWARIDSDGLLNWLRNLPSKERQAIRATVRNSVAAVLSQRDPAQAVSLLLESPDGENGGDGEVELNIFEYWGKGDPLAASQRALLLPGGRGRSTALAITIEQWIKTDRAAAIAWVKSIPDPGLAREAGIKLTERLGLIDPEAAVKFAVEKGVADGDSSFPRDACGRWVKRDQAGALAWAQTLPASPSRDVTVARMLANVATTQPQTAARLFLAELERGADMAEASGDIIQGLVKAGDGITLGSILEHLPESERQSLTSRVTGTLSNEMEPAKILTIGLQLPPGPARERWLQDSVGWITQQRGLQQAREAIETLPAGPERNSYVAAAVLKEFSMSREIEDAVALAQTVPNGRDCIKQGVSGWLGSTDATAARNWLRQTHALSEEEKQQLLQRAAGEATVVPPSATGVRPGSESTIPRP